jgi:UDP-N-acetylglucosamine 2-epimerase (non-hydrolysing)
MATDQAHAGTGLPERSVAVVLGTRPEIIKLAGIIRLLGPAARLVHTGQHYDPNLSDTFFAEMQLPAPDIHLGVGGASRGAQIGAAISAVESFLGEAAAAGDRPLAVVVQGDTNAVLAGAIAANAREVPLVHIEAGLRSRDRRMPEEHNRVVADHLADRLCAPTAVNRDNLAAEGIAGDRVVVTGNTVIEAVMDLLPDPERRAAVRDRYGVTENGYVLSTLHRPENVDDPATLRVILEQLAALPVPVILPMHPRTVRRVADFGLSRLLERIEVVEPIGYRDFLALGAGAALLVSDSGGVQEEVSVYKRPLIVVRRSTERPEVLGTFAERILPGREIGDLARAWLDDLTAVHAKLAGLSSPYGDGTASARSVGAIRDLVHG